MASASDSIMHKVLGAILMASVLLVYGIGSVLTVEFEHHHHAEDQHDHVGAELLLVHHDDGSHHEPVNSPCNEQGDDDDSAPGSSHSHGVSLGVDAPAAWLGFTNGYMPPQSGRALRFPAREAYPDGPSFDLIKPPQLV